MNEKIEIKGKTVQDAVAEALLRLGARRDEVVVKVIDEPKSGFLGLGGRPAKVEVERKQQNRSQGTGRRRPDSEGHSLSDSPESGRARGGRGGSRRGRRPAARRDGSEPQAGRSGETQGRGSRAADPKKEDTSLEGGVKREQSRRSNPRNDKPREEGRGRSRRSRPVAKAEPSVSEKNPGEQAAAPQKSDDRNGRNPRNRRGSRPRQARPEPSPVIDQAPPKQEAPRMENKPTDSTAATVVREGLVGVSFAEPTREVAAADVKETLEKMAGGMLLRAGFPCRCQVLDGEYLQVRVVTDDASAGMLIGRHGSAVDSVEHLVERMISTASGDRVKMNLDINNYRRRRQDTLADRVYDAIGKVKETGQDYHLEPMNARERRLVHLQVAEFEGMSTTTVIDDGAKHVVISRGDGAASDGTAAGEVTAAVETPDAQATEDPADASQPDG